MSSSITIRLCLALVFVLSFLVFGHDIAAQPSPSLISLSRQPVMLRASHGTHRSRVELPHQVAAHIQSSAITVTYTGFPAEAQAAFQAAVDVWQTQVSSPVAITIQANWTPLASDVLGSAQPYHYFLLNNVIYPVALLNKIVGTDVDPNQPDIVANFNSNFVDWYYGTDGNTPQALYDLETVVLHELGHGLGIVGSMTVDNSTNQGKWGANGYPLVFDRFAVNGANQLLINTNLFSNASTALKDQLTSDNIFFNGAQALIATGGVRPKLFAPLVWQQGSSYSHLDEATYPQGNVNSLMTPFLNNGESIHQPGPIILGMLTDIGWTTTPPLLATTTLKPSASATATFKPSPSVTLTIGSSIPATSTRSSMPPTTTATIALSTPTTPSNSFKVYLGVVKCNPNSQGTC